MRYFNFKPKTFTRSLIFAKYFQQTKTNLSIKIKLKKKSFIYKKKETILFCC